MNDNVLELPPNSNTAEPDMLVVHCPRSVSVMPWDALSQWFVAEYVQHGWRLVQEPDAWHLITPLHPAMRM